METASLQNGFQVYNDRSCKVYTHLAVDGNITCSGSITGSISGNASPFWAAGKIDHTGSVQINKGSNNLACVRNGSDTCYDITYPTHPDGVNATILVTSSEWRNLIRDQTPTGFRLYLRNVGNSGNLEGPPGQIHIAILK